MPWYTLVRGPGERPVPYLIPDKERSSIREVEGATLFDHEDLALMAIREHFTPMPPRARFVSWNGKARLFVLIPSDAERRVRAHKRERPW